MGVLTDDMTRLRDEVNALGNARREFVQRSSEDVASMRTQMRADNTARAVNVQEALATNETERAAETRRSQNVRMDFLSDLRGRVGEMIMVLRGAHAERAAAQREFMCAGEAARVEEARQSSSERAGFVDAIRTVVSRLRGEFAAEMAGARLAWFGPGTAEEPDAKRPAPVKAKQKPATKAPDAAPDDLTTI